MADAEDAMDPMARAETAAVIVTRRVERTAGIGGSQKKVTRNSRREADEQRTTGRLALV